jgi:hypothetical protein
MSRLIPTLASSPFAVKSEEKARRAKSVEAVELFTGRCCHSRQRGETAGIGQAEAQRSEFFSSIQLIGLLADPDWLPPACFQ